MRLLYATETGTAAELSQLTVEYFANYVIHCKIARLCDYDYTQLPLEDLVLFIIPTTGDGEVPHGKQNSLHLLSLQRHMVVYRYAKVLALSTTERLAFSFPFSCSVFRIRFR